MSEVVASKVVELKFNNKDFEKNVATSLSTIEKLKKSLNFDTVTTSVNLLQNALQLKGLKNIQSQLGGISRAVDQQVGPLLSTIDSVGDAITNSIGGAIEGVVSQIKTGGMSRAMNIEKAKFSLQGIGIDWKDIGDSISKSVKGTAYGLDSAAKAAATLSASGVTLKTIGKDVVNTKEDLTEMEMVLKGISGVAAQTNMDFDSVAHVFTTVAGNGRLMGMQLSQLSTYGMNAAADLGKAMNKTESEIRDMASKGEISAEQFFNTMYKIYWKNAAKANDTLEGVTSNIRSALGRIGAAFYTPLIENKGPVVQLLNEYMKTIDTIAAKLKPLGSKDDKGNDISGKLVKYVSYWLIQDIKLITNFLNNLRESGDIMKVWRGLYRLLKSGFKIFQTAINFAITLGSAFKQAFPKSILDTIIDINTYIFRFVNIFYKGSKNITKNAEILGWTFKRVSEMLNPIYQSIKNLIKAFGDFFDETFENVKPLETFIDTISKISEYLQIGVISTEQWRDALDGLWKIVEHVWGVLKAFGEAIYETFTEGNFHPIRYLIDLIKTLTSGLVSNDKKTNQLKNTFKIFTTIAGVIAKVFGAVGLVLAQVVNWGLKLGGVILYITSPIGTLVSKIFELVTGAAEAFRNIDFKKYANLKTVIDGFKNLFSKMKDIIKQAATAVSEFVENTIEKMHIDWDSIFDGIFKALDWVADKALKVKDAIENGVGKAIDFIGPKFKSIKDGVQDAFGKGSRKAMEDSKGILEKISNIDVAGGIEKGLSKIGKFFKNLGKAIANSPLIKAISKDLTAFFKGFIEDIKKFANMKNTAKGITGIAETIADSIGKALDFVFSILDKVYDKLMEYGGGERIRKVIENIVDVLMAFTAYNWAKAFKAFSDSLGDLGKLSSINVTIKKAQNEFEVFAQSLKEIGKGLLMIAAALYIVSTIDDPKKLWTSVAIIGGFMALISALGLYLMGKDNKGGRGIDILADFKDKQATTSIPIDSLKLMSDFIKQLSKSILLIAISLKLLDGADPASMFLSAGILLSMMAAIVAVAKYLTENNEGITTIKWNEKSSNDIVKTIKAIVGCMTTIAVVVALLGLLPTKVVQKGGAAAAVIATVMVGVMFAVAKISEVSNRNQGGYKQMAALVSSMPALATALFVAAKAIALLGVLPKKVVKQGGLAALQIIGAFVLIMLALGAAGKADLKASTIAAMAGAILAMSAAMVVMSVAIGILGSMKPATVAKGLLAIIGALVALVAIGMLAEKSGGAMGLYAIAAVMVSIGAAAILLAASIWLVVKAAIALAKAGPGAVVAIGAVGYAVGAALGSLLEGIADSIGKILKACWDIIVAIGDFLLEKTPDIVQWIYNFVGILIGSLIGKLPYLIKPIISGIGELFSSGAHEITGNVSDELRQEITDLKDHLISTKEETDKAFTGTDNTIKHYQDLKDKLDDCVTASGKIKEGHENEAKEIVEELNGALDTNFTIRGNVIQGYKDEMAAIDQLIEKKRAEMYLNNAQSGYEDAVKNEKKALEELNKAQDAYDKSATEKESNEQLQRTLEGQIAIINAKAELTENDRQQRATLKEQLEEAKEDHKDYVDAVLKDQETLWTAQDNYGEIQNKMHNYEQLQDAILKGDADAMAEWAEKTKNNWQDVNYTTERGLTQQYAYWEEEVGKLEKALKNDPTNKAIKENLDEAKQMKEKAYKEQFALTEEEIKKEADARTEAEKKVAKDTKDSMNSQARLQEDRAKQNKSYWEGYAQESMNAQAKTAQSPVGKMIKSTAEEDEKAAKEQGKKVVQNTKAGMEEEVENINYDEINKKFKQDGIDTGKYFPEGFKEGCDFSTALPAMKADGINLGEYFSGGFIEGINNKLGGVFNVAALMGETAVDGERTSTDTNSPSKVMIENGRYFVEGFINGIKNTTGKASEQSIALAKAVMNSFDNTIDSDYSPTITPVVDLSNVNSAAGSINGLFGNRSIGLSSNIGAVSASMREIQNTDKNAGLIAAINGLNGTTNNNVYNVNGITYDDGSNIADAVGQLINAAMIERRM